MVKIGTNTPAGIARVLHIAIIHILDISDITYCKDRDKDSSRNWEGVAYGRHPELKQFQRMR